MEAIGVPNKINHEENQKDLPHDGINHDPNDHFFEIRKDFLRCYNDRIRHRSLIKLNILIIRADLVDLLIQNKAKLINSMR